MIPWTSNATFRIDRTNPEPALIVTGRVTVDASPGLRSMLLDLIRTNPRRGLVLDLSGVTHIDTSGFAALLEALKYAHENSVWLRLTGIGGQPKRLAEVAQLDDIFRAMGSEVQFR